MLCMLLLLLVLHMYAMLTHDNNDHYNLCGQNIEGNIGDIESRCIDSRLNLKASLFILEFEARISSPKG